jgi:hypothetical protein
VVLDLIGVPFLEAGDNNTHFIVYLNDLEKILVDQPIALRLAKTQKVLHLAHGHGGFGGGCLAFFA